MQQLATGWVKKRDTERRLLQFSDTCGEGPRAEGWADRPRQARCARVACYRAFFRVAARRAHRRYRGGQKGDQRISRRSDGRARQRVHWRGMSRPLAALIRVALQGDGSAPRAALGVASTLPHECTSLRPAQSCARQRTAMPHPCTLIAGSVTLRRDARILEHRGKGRFGRCVTSAAASRNLPAGCCMPKKRPIF